MAGDTNLYRYVLNNPISFTDPSGLIPAVVAGVIVPGAYEGLSTATLALLGATETLGLTAANGALTATVAEFVSAEIGTVLLANSASSSPRCSPTQPPRAPGSRGNHRHHRPIAGTTAAVATVSSRDFPRPCEQLCARGDLCHCEHLQARIGRCRQPRGRRRALRQARGRHQSRDREPHSRRVPRASGAEIHR